jgi:hypothetical protein
MKQFVITPGIESLIDSGTDIAPFIARHLEHDWGDMCASDKALNDEALLTRDRLHSAYTAGETPIWVITDAGWEVTTVLLPGEY